MKKVLFMFLVLILHFNLFAQDMTIVDLKNLDGLQKPIVGLMGGYVPKNYFTANLEKKGTMDLNYHTSLPLTIDILQEKDVYLYLENKTGAPIVISFKFNGQWQNFIVNMNDSHIKKVKIDYFLAKLNVSLDISSISIDSLVLTSGDFFKASLESNSSTKDFKVDNPKKTLTEKQSSKVTTNVFWAAIVTGHPGVDLDGDAYAYIKITNEINGVSNNAWLKISCFWVPNNSCTGYPPHQQGYLSFRVDYPNKGDEWHWQDDKKQSWVLHYCQGDALNYCYVGDDTIRENFNFYTCCLKEKPYETKHKWCNIRNMYWYGEEACVIRYSPPNDYLKWKVELIHR